MTRTVETGSFVRAAGQRRKGLPSLAWLALIAGAHPFASAAITAGQLQEGKADFVVTHIEYALSLDASETGACPDGLSEGYRNPADILVHNPGLVEEEGELPEDFGRRVRKATVENPDIKNLCHNPELGKPDPTFRTVTGPDVPVFGIDIDGHDSVLEEQPASGFCPHSDFVGMNGEAGIDNQFFRAVGCTKGYQPLGQANSFAIEMISGSWGVLIRLADVDDLDNDDFVEVSIYANGDPIRLSPGREPLAYASYSIHSSRDFRSTTRGRIVDGVLSTDPVDVRIPYVVDATLLMRTLRGARLQVELDGHEKLTGYLAGYSPVETLYDATVAPRSARRSSGEITPAARSSTVGIGKADAFGHTCEGLYQALLDNADGYPDPETGRCTAISTQYRITAIPAFIVGPTADEEVSR